MKVTPKNMPLGHQYLIKEPVSLPLHYLKYQLNISVFQEEEEKKSNFYQRRAKSFSSLTYFEHCFIDVS